MMELSPLRTDAEKHDPPTVRGSDKITVAKRLKRIVWQLAMGENRILRVRLERSPGRIAARDGQPVVVARAAFGNQQIVFALNFVQMRAFGPDTPRPAPQLL